MKPLDTGGTRRDAFRVFRIATGGRRHRDDTSDQVPFPEGLEYLWRWYTELEAGRPVQDGFLLPIPPSEYVAWATLSRVSLRPWEVRVLRAIDAAALRVAQEK